MKNRTLIFTSGIALALLSLAACDKSTTGDAISEDEVVDIIENSISSESEGYLAQVSDAAAIVDSYDSYTLKALESDSSLSQICGIGFDSTITRSKLSGTRTYSFDFSWSWSLSCSLSDNPLSFEFAFSGTGSYDALRMSGDDSFSNTFVVTGLEPAAGEYIYNGSYLREGTQQSKVLDKQSFESKVTLNSTDIRIDKTAYTINGGEISFTLTGNSSGGEEFTRTGTIILNGDGTATVSISSGGSYIVEV